MARLTDHAALVIRLHELEFTQDFVLFGESLYWVQEKMFLQPREYNLVLCLEVPFPDEMMDGELVVLGVHVPSLGVKGILMNHYSHTPEVPSVITRKLSEMGFYSISCRETLNVRLDFIKPELPFLNGTLRQTLEQLQP